MLDPADLVMIAGRTLGISTDDALAQMDIAAARDALAEARPPGQERGLEFSERAGAAAAGAALMRALLHHRPFPEHGQQVAVAAGLQFLSLNGWTADLNPAATAVVVVEALASGRLTSADAAAWLSPRLSQARGTAKAPVVPGVRPWLPVSLPVLRVPAGQKVAGAVLAAAVAGAAVLAAAACSRAPYVPAAPSGGASVASQSASAVPGQPAVNNLQPASGLLHNPGQTSRAVSVP